MGGKDCRLLVKLARAAIESAMTKKDFNLDPYKQFSEHHGVFVTLTKDGELRGCIGYITCEQPVYKGVVHAARAAAFDDPRFPRLEPEELGAIRIEVSVLTEPEEVKVKKSEEYLKKIKVGRDGLIIKQGYRTGLLLPQVPTEYGWNIETYLEHLCLKAGLPKDAWKKKETRIDAFQAKVKCED
ncbi:AmmeMemoRadiSam system protein A [Candidatus Woesearchaeota archaeon]|nr:AmmeMemoRadiSam system protein A [Candidatus Woesearchaeota archaeon]